MWSRRDEAIYDRMAGDEHEDRIAAARRRNAEIEREEIEREAAAKAEAALRARRNNAVMHMREYQKAGVAPRKLDENGYPVESLTMLLDLGWTIEPAFGGGNELVPPKPGRARWSSDSA
jgi:hypothetical protein